MKLKLLAISKEFKIDTDTMEKVEGIVEMDAEYFNGDLSPENVAKMSRDALISIITDLHNSLPESHFTHKDVYEEDYIEVV